MQKFAVAAFAAGLLCAAPVLAQDAPEEAVKSLWCGLAFVDINETLPDDPPAEMVAIAAPLPAFGEVMLTDAEAAYLAAGFTAESFATTRDELKPKVIEQLTGQDVTAAQFTFEDCFALVPQPEAAPADAAPAAPAAPAPAPAN